MIATTISTFTGIAKTEVISTFVKQWLVNYLNYHTSLSKLSIKTNFPMKFDFVPVLKKTAYLENNFTNFKKLKLGKMCTKTTLAVDRRTIYLKL